MIVILDFLKNNKLEILCTFLFILISISFYRLRTKKAIQNLIIESIKETEKYFNSDNGQDKLNIIEESIKNKISTLPFFLRILAKCFCSKYWIVTTIEALLNELQDIFDENAVDVDIIGNEINKKKELK